MHIDYGEKGTRVEGMARFISQWMPGHELPENTPVIRAHFINEGATLILETDKERMALHVSEEDNKQMCDLLFKMFSSP